MNRHEAIPARADADELPAALGSREPSGASTQVWLTLKDIGKTMVF